MIPSLIEHHGIKSETEGALIETHEAFLPVDEAFFLNRDAFKRTVEQNKYKH